MWLGRPATCVQSVLMRFIKHYVCLGVHPRVSLCVCARVFHRSRAKRYFLISVIELRDMTSLWQLFSACVCGQYISVSCQFTARHVPSNTWALIDSSNAIYPSDYPHLLLMINSRRCVCYCVILYALIFCRIPLRSQVLLSRKSFPVYYIINIDVSEIRNIFGEVSRQKNRTTSDCSGSGALFRFLDYTGSLRVLVWYSVFCCVATSAVKRRLSPSWIPRRLDTPGIKAYDFRRSWPCEAKIYPITAGYKSQVFSSVS